MASRLHWEGAFRYTVRAAYFDWSRRLALLITNQGGRSDWPAYSGEIFMADHITVGGFRAGGFSVRVRVPIQCNAKY